MSDLRRVLAGVGALLLLSTAPMAADAEGAVAKDTACLEEALTRIAVDLEYGRLVAFRRALSQGPRIKMLDRLSTPELRGRVWSLEVRTAQVAGDFRFIRLPEDRCEVLAGSFELLDPDLRDPVAAELLAVSQFSIAAAELGLSPHGESEAISLILDVERILRPYRAVRLVASDGDVWMGERSKRGRRIPRDVSALLRGPQIVRLESTIMIGKVFIWSPLGGFLEELRFLIRKGGALSLAREVLADGVGPFTERTLVDARH